MSVAAAQHYPAPSYYRLKLVWSFLNPAAGGWSTLDPTTNLPAGLGERRKAFGRRSDDLSGRALRFECATFPRTRRQDASTTPVV